MIEPENNFEQQRAKMVKQQLRARGIKDEAILNAMGSVPREAFVLPAYRHYAYDDTPLPIPDEQTISQPYVVALMISMMQLQPTDRVLEVGAGSGYAAAVLSRIVTAVYTVERHEGLVHFARERLEALGYDNVHVKLGDGTRGWEEHAPYDGIIVAAGGPRVPSSLRQQLALNGRMVIPVGRRRRRQRLVRIVRKGPDHFKSYELSPVAFVPLIGNEGWEEK